MTTPLPGKGSPIQNNRMDVLKSATNKQSSLGKPAKPIGPQKVNNVSSSFRSIAARPKLNQSSLPTENNRPLVPPQKNQNTEIKKDKGSSLFSGTGISRRSLVSKMKVDPKVREAARKSYINLGDLNKDKLVKETFGSASGNYISESDLKRSMMKLHKKMYSAKTSEEHAKYRKQIDFFKKLRDIK